MLSTLVNVCNSEFSLGFVVMCGLSDEKADKKCNPPLANAGKKGLNVLKLELSSVALN